MSKKEPPRQLKSFHPSSPAIPWASTATWGKANLAIGHLCTRHHASLESVRKTARDLQACLETFFPILDCLCSQTCPECQAPCCQVATVWFDFKDLVFMHLSGSAIATVQLTRTPAGECGCCGPSGCRLPRLSRPWICSWYLCPSQKTLLAAMPAKTAAQFEKTVIEIKQLRNRMETEFIRITS